MSDTTVPAVGLPINPQVHRVGPFLPGARVGGRYTIEEEIGIGGMGVVYRARQDLTRKQVALKVIRSAWHGGPLLDRFLEEIRLLGRLEHHGLVAIHDADLHHCVDGEDALFFTMDLIDGVPITTWAEQRALDRGGRISLITRVCEAMQYAHDHGVIHCDLKPGNLLVRPNGDPVVIDFGLAYLRRDAEGTDLVETPAADRLDGLGRGIAGTPPYMSPEQFQGGVQEVRSGQSVDVYALGVVTFELLAGRLPYTLPPAPVLEDYRRAVTLTPAHKLMEFLPAVDPELDRVVAKSLRKDPADRYFSVTQFLRALTRFLPKAAPAKEPEWVPAQGRIIPSTNWVLDDRLGEGAVGEVWTCHHRTLHHKRIVKFCASEEKAAFLRRELTLYRLLKEKVGQNPHFARLEEVALDEPPRYLMSEYIEALDLAKWHDAHQKNGPIPEAAVLEIVAQSATALQAAHDAGVLHRDVKPSNIFLRGQPSDLSSLHVWVGDFGIGQVISEEILGDTTRGGFTRTLLGKGDSGYSGTHFYMAPELLAGGQASVRSDIYALGVVLYQALTGDFQRVVTIDWASDVPDPLLRSDLERCFARNPGSRFPSAAEFADNLRRLPERRAEHARAANEAAQRERQAYRRGLARAGALAAAVVAVVSSLAVFGFYQSNIAEARANEALTERGNAIEARTKTLLGEIKALRTSTEVGKKQAAWQRVEELSGFCPTDLLEDLKHEAVAVKALQDVSLTPLPSLSFQQPAWAGPGLRHVVARDSDGTLHRFNRSGDTWTRDQPMPPAPEGATSFILSPNGEIVGAWLAGGQGVAACFNEAWRPLGRGPATAFAVADSGLAAVGRPDGTIEIHRADHPDGPTHRLGVDRASVATLTTTPRSKKNLLPSLRPSHRLVFDESGQRLAAASRDSLVVSIWNTENGSLEAMATHFRPVTALAWHAPESTDEFALRHPGNQSTLATGQQDGSLLLWDLDARQGPVGTEHHAYLRPPLELPSAGPRSSAVLDITFASFGRDLIALFENQKIAFFDRLSGAPIDALDAPFPAESLVVDEFQNLALQTSAGNLSALGTESNPAFDEARLFFTPVREIDSDSRGQLAVARNPEGTVLITPVGLRPLHRFHQAFGNSARFVPKVDALFTIGGGIVKVWRRKSPDLSEIITYERDRATGSGAWATMDTISLSDDHRLAAFASKGDLGLIDNKDGTLFEIPKVVDGTISRFKLHPGGEWAAVIPIGVGPGKIVRLSDHKITTLPFPPSQFLDLTFSPKGKLLVLRDAKAIHVFNAPAWEHQFSSDLPSRIETDAPIAFSSDESLFVAADEEGQPVLFALPTDLTKQWKKSATLRVPQPRDPTCFRFGGPGGTYLLAGTTDGYLQVWNIARLRQLMKPAGLDWDWPEWKTVDLPTVRQVKFLEPQ